MLPIAIADALKNLSYRVLLVKWRCRPMFKHGLVTEAIITMWLLRYNTHLVTILSSH